MSVLMGTAYLFTEEAVRCGAIVPGYQRAARQCTATALLETSPGHVTRCADTPYVASFAEAKRRLLGKGERRRVGYRSFRRGPPSSSSTSGGCVSPPRA